MSVYELRNVKVALPASPGDATITTPMYFQPGAVVVDGSGNAYVVGPGYTTDGNGDPWTDSLDITIAGDNGALAPYQLGDFVDAYMVGSTMLSLYTTGGA